VPTANQDNGGLRRDPVDIPPQREPLLLQLPLVPVSIADDDAASAGFLDASADRAENVID
jgi:hypothetical protein